MEFYGQIGEILIYENENYIYFTFYILAMILHSNGNQCHVMYKPDSKKVGTLYKLWIKKECNNLQIL